MDLPDFLQLSEDAVKREEERQRRLRQEFGTRARQTPAEMEAARALIVEDSLRKALATGEETERVSNQLAENLAMQGRFLEAAQTAVDEQAKEYYQKAFDALTSGECDCAPKTTIVDHHRIQLPKYRVIKEIYSIPAGHFGFLSECSRGGHWCFLSNNPVPPAEPQNDLERLKV
jgi:hypothetical protein